MIGSSSPSIFIRQANGLAFQCPYSKYQLLSQLLKEIFKKQLPIKLRALSKGRLLEFDQTLQQNGLKANQIIHLLTLSRNGQESGYIYLSFADKIYKISFGIQQTVRNLKNRIEKQTSVQFGKQIILYNSIQLQNFKLLKDYEIRSGDFLCMAQIKEKKPLILDLPQIIFPNKNALDKRRGSQCIINKNQQIQNVKKSRIYQTFNDKIANEGKLIVSCTTPQLTYLRYGPSPLSQYDQSFRSCMDQWMKGQPQTISEHFIQQSYQYQAGSRAQNKAEHCKNLKDTEDLTPVIGSYFGQRKQLCESQIFKDQDIQPSSLTLAEPSKNYYSKIVPKIVFSTEIESPTKRLQRSEDQLKQKA